MQRCASGHPPPSTLPTCFVLNSWYRTTSHSLLRKRLGWVTSLRLGWVAAALLQSGAWGRKTLCVHPRATLHQSECEYSQPTAIQAKGWGRTRCRTPPHNRHTMPCRATSCRAMPCHAIPCHAIPCHAIPYHAIPYHTILYLITPNYPTRYHKPHHAAPSHAMLRRTSCRNSVQHLPQLRVAGGHTILHYTIL